jgi:hypothetical protein
MKTFHRARTECLMVLRYFYKRSYKELVELKVADVPTLKDSLSSEERLLLESYLLLRETKMHLFPMDPGILFCTHGGQKMSPMAMHAQVSRLLEEADLTISKTGPRS